MPKRIPLSAALAAALLATSAAAAADLRVCANPDDLPFSDARGEGFENRLAQLIARDLGETVQYTWTDEHENFVRKTLDAGKCDVLMGVPAGFGEVATTRPYYTASYVFVSRADRGLHLSSIRDPRLRNLKIGVHIIGDDNTPPAEALSRQGITGNVAGYLIFHDAYGKSRSHLLDDVAAGKIDVAAVWGPVAEYYASRVKPALAIAPITGTEAFAPLAFQFPIALGVRKDDLTLKERLNAVLARDRKPISDVLSRYGIAAGTSWAGAAGSQGR